MPAQRAINSVRRCFFYRIHHQPAYQAHNKLRLTQYLIEITVVIDAPRSDLPFKIYKNLVDLYAMANSNLEMLLGGKAYRLFFDEYGERLSHANQLMEQGIDSSRQCELQARFHRLKGSAGFFGFDEIHRIASELEKLFSKTTVLTRDDIEHAREYLDSLEQCGTKMPTPPEKK